LSARSFVCKILCLQDPLSARFFVCKILCLQDQSYGCAVWGDRPSFSYLPNAYHRLSFTHYMGIDKRDPEIKLAVFEGIGASHKNRRNLFWMGYLENLNDPSN